MTTLSLRPATAADLDALVALVNSAYRGESSKKGWTTEADLLGGQRTDPVSLGKTMGAPDNVILVHESEGRLLACVHLEKHGEQGAYLGMLTVEPTLQAGGFGKRLLAAAEEWARTQWGTRSIHMTVIRQRKALIAWYERRGYRLTGETKPWPYGDDSFGLPKVPDLIFEVLEKAL
ncbi:MAG: GNAT family N-acetyltransferase [Deltaproteobacteria bacterium]|nr:GNAT family N-acetyltransferase [Deltaproteobacteria bacterium]